MTPGVRGGTIDDDGPSIDQRDYVAVAVLLFIYFGIMFVLSAGESIGIPLVMDEFGWSPSKVRVLCQTRRRMFYFLARIVMSLCATVMVVDSVAVGAGRMGTT